MEVGGLTEVELGGSSLMAIKSKSYSALVVEVFNCSRLGEDEEEIENLS